MHQNICKEKSLIKLSTVSANFWNTLKCFPNIFFYNEMILVHSLPCFFICINKKLSHFTISVWSVVLLLLRRISELIETKYFRWHVAIQLQHSIDIKGKNIFLLNNSVVNILSWTFTGRFKKKAFTRILAFLSELQHIQIKIFIITFKLVIVESTQVISKPLNIWKYISLSQVPFF